MKNNKTDRYSIQIINQPTELNIIVRCLEMLAERWGWSAGVKHKINLSLEEIVTNIIFHGYTDEKEHLIAVTFEKNGSEYYIQIEDDGIAFNPLESELEVDVNASIEEREIGGLGIHIVKTIMDKVSYAYVDGKNRITLLKRDLKK